MLAKLISYFFKPPKTAVDPFPKAPVDPPQRFETWSIAGIRFDQTGLVASAASDASMTWTADGAEIELTSSTRSEDVDAENIARIRDEQRRLALANGRSLVSAEVAVNQQGLPLLEVISKKRKGLGYDFVGSTTINRPDGCCVVRMIADEGGFTGFREATVSATLFELGQLKLPAGGPPGVSQPLEGWTADPYDPAWDDEGETAVTEDERLDVAFPKHPLSRVRAFLATLRDTVKLDHVTNESRQPHPPHLVTSGPRRPLSAAAVREVQWKAQCFDAIAATLDAEIRSAVSDAPTPDIAESAVMLGIVRARQARHAEAVAILSRALTMFLRLYEADHVKAAVARTHMARSCKELARLNESEALFLEAIPVLERDRPNHLVLGMALNGYGAMLLGRNKPEGREYVIRAKAMFDSLGGGQRLFLLQEAAGEPAPAGTANTVIVKPPA